MEWKTSKYLLITPIKWSEQYQNAHSLFKVKQSTEISLLLSLLGKFIFIGPTFLFFKVFVSLADSLVISEVKFITGEVPIGFFKLFL